MDVMSFIHFEENNMFFWQQILSDFEIFRIMNPLVETNYYSCASFCYFVS